MQIIFHRLADAEHLRVCRMLRKESVTKRNRFVQSVDDAIQRIVANPATGSPVFGMYRWVRVGRFKSLLFYRRLAAD